MKYLSSSLLLSVLALLGIGVVQVYSSSYVLATETYGDGLFFFKRQLLFALVGFMVLMISIHIPWRIVENWGWVLWAVATSMVTMTFIPKFGVRVGGALRWIQITGTYRFEPAEFLKVVFVIFVASFMCRQENFLKNIKLSFWEKN